MLLGTMRNELIFHLVDWIFCNSDLEYVPMKWVAEWVDTFLADCAARN